MYITQTISEKYLQRNEKRVEQGKRKQCQTSTQEHSITTITDYKIYITTDTNPYRVQVIYYLIIWITFSLVIFKELQKTNTTGFEEYITKSRLCNFDPLKPHFYIVKLGFTGVYIIFLISDQNIDCGYSLEPPRRGGSKEYPQSIFLAEI